MVTVLVGQYDESQGGFSGFWAEFEGEEVSSYKDERGDKNVTYTLYRCTAYEFEAYRVHVADETDPQAPVYRLNPGSEEERYEEPYDERQVASFYPLFGKGLDDLLPTRHIDPPPRHWRRQR